MAVHQSVGKHKCTYRHTYLLVHPIQTIFMYAQCIKLSETDININMMCLQFCMFIGRTLLKHF